MRKCYAVSTLIALFLTNLSFADVTTGDDDLSSKQCESVAKACVGAGYIRAGGEGKMFWKDCMKPILLGRKVTGVNISQTDAMACKQIKIKNMQNELRQFQQ